MTKPVDFWLLCVYYSCNREKAIARCRILNHLNLTSVSAVSDEELLKDFLSEINQPQMIEALSYCFKELVYNAKKANTKRVYFEERQLDINNPDDYAKGMEGFKKDTLKNQKYLHS